MLYTRKGDDGTTRTFGCNQKISKSSTITEALGACDEVNSFLGLVKVKSNDPELIHWIQEGLFIVQAELAGADKTITKERVQKVEEHTDNIEKMLPPITTFFISGGTELAALSDVARTLVRRAERRVVAVQEEGVRMIHPETLVFMNRLSSLLYALARLSNHLSGIKEQPPQYK
jgi:cob(I)alamin adenosyltransferase